MKWPSYPLSQLSERFISGGTPSTKHEEYWDGDIPWITGADFNDGNVILGRRYINNLAVKNSATNIVPKGSILMVTRTGVGKIAVAPVDIAISQDITGIVLKPKVNVKFVLTAIRNKMTVILAAQRGATIKGVTRKDVESLRISLPSPSEQNHIVEILDQADVLRKKRAEADTKAARILPALFYEMFGDPATNPKGWPIKRLGDSEVATINPRFSSKHISHETEFSFVPMADVDEVWGRIVGQQVRPYSEVMRGFTPFQSDDVLFAKITPCMQNGKVAIARNLVNGWGFGSTEFHVLRTGILSTPEWLYALARLPWFRKQAESSFTGTVGQQRVPKDFLENYKIGCPPIKLQHKFGEELTKLQNWVYQTDRSRKELESIFLVLLHHAFTENLTAKWREAHMKELLAEMEEQAKALGKGEWP